MPAFSLYLYHALYPIPTAFTTFAHTAYRWSVYTVIHYMTHLFYHTTHLHACLPPTQDDHVTWRTAPLPLPSYRTCLPAIPRLPRWGALHFPASSVYMRAPALRAHIHIPAFLHTRSLGSAHTLPRIPSHTGLFAPASPTPLPYTPHPHAPHPTPPHHLGSFMPRAVCLMA